MEYAKYVAEDAAVFQQMERPDDPGMGGAAVSGFPEAVMKVNRPV